MIKFGQSIFAKSARMQGLLQAGKPLSVLSEDPTGSVYLYEAGQTVDGIMTSWLQRLTNDLSLCSFSARSTSLCACLLMLQMGSQSPTSLSAERVRGERKDWYLEKDGNDGISHQIGCGHALPLQHNMCHLFTLPRPVRESRQPSEPLVCKHLQTIDISTA